MVGNFDTLRNYEIEAIKTDKIKKQADADLPLLGLFGEVGTLLSEVKKKQRDSNSYIGYKETVTEELGDVLWYLTIIGHRANLSLESIASEEEPSRFQQSTSEITFKEIQPQPLLPLEAPTPGFERTLLALGSATGELMRLGSSGLNREAALPPLKKIFSSLVQAANEAGLTLSDAATSNIRKTQDRWPLERSLPKPFDEHYEEEEQLPRKRTIEIFERTVAGRTYVVQRCNGIYIGDRVTDNILEEDDYRFHDAFHYAYAAVLGWSPVIRALFRLKRKSKEKIDEAQDGARAILIEEGVSTFIFGQAKQLNFFQNQKSGDLSFTLLKRVHDFVRGYEPESCPLWLWEESILQGFEAFRFLKQHRRGQLHLDLTDRRLKVSTLPAAPTNVEAQASAPKTPLDIAPKPPPDHLAL